MQMDNRVILAGEPVNALGSFMGGQQAAQQTRQFQQQNALADLYQTQGAGIMAGDANALNALAGIDPQAAMGIKNQQQGLAMDQERLNMARASAAREAAAWAQSQDQATVAAERDKLATGLKGAAYFHAQGDQAGYMAFLQQNGLDPKEYPFEQFPAFAAAAEGVLEAWQAFTPKQDAFRAATPEEAAQYGASGGQFGSDGRFYPINPPSGMSVKTNPDGGVELVQGPGAGTSQKPFTEAQGKDVTYATRAEGALNTLEPVADSLTSRGNHIAEMVPLGLARGLQSDAFQIATNAGREFAAAILRKDSGAAITANEEKIYGEVYLPQPGDGEALLAVKREARMRALAALKSGMSPDQILAQGRALVSSASGSGPITQPSQRTAAPVTIKDDAEWEALPPGTQYIGPDGVQRTKK